MEIGGLFFVFDLDSLSGPVKKLKKRDDFFWGHGHGCWELLAVGNALTMRDA